MLDKWVKKNSEEAVVEKLVTALSVSGFLDVKLRVEKLLEMNLYYLTTDLVTYKQNFRWHRWWSLLPIGATFLPNRAILSTFHFFHLFPKNENCGH